MDKLNRALVGVEDNTLSINRTYSYINARTSAITLYGKKSGGKTTFGNLTAQGDFVVFVQFDGTACELYFNGAFLAGSGSPVIAAGGSGSGELVLGGERDNARAVLFGAVKIA